MSDTRPTPGYRLVTVPEHPYYAHALARRPDVQSVIDSLGDGERLVSVYPVSSIRMHTENGELYYVPILEAVIECSR
jgi:hypothetical protein